MRTLFSKRILRAGFTLTEMLTVVLIVGVLVGLAVPQYRRTIQRARATEAISMLRELADSAARLASAFGYRTVAGFAQSSRDGAKFVFTRLDMIDTETVPCTFTGTTMTCDYFIYTLNGNGTISATQKSTNVVLTVNPDEPTSSDNYIVCAEPEGSAYFCDLYGYGTDEEEENEEENEDEAGDQEGEN